MKKLKTLCLILMLTLLVSGCGGTQQERPTTTTVKEGSGQLEVHYIDVGQADAILIKTPSQGNILIDGGTNSNEKDLVAYLESQQIKKLDYVIGTHPHEDHIGGLDAVINHFEIGAVYLPKVSHTTKTFEDLLTAIKGKKLKATVARADVTLPLGEGGAQAVFLAPNGDQYESLNNYSAVLKLTYGNTRFLFTGDAEGLSEKEMLAHYKAQDLQADVLKMGHHGSSTSTIPEFFAAVKPSLAIISCGKDNDYGHPHTETLALLKKGQVPYLRTDQEGTIVVTSDGQKITRGQGTVAVKGQTDAATVPAVSQGVAVVGANGGATPIEGQIVIDTLDKVAEVVTLKNNGQATVDLSGWVLVSVKGDQRYTLPSGTMLPGGATLKIVSGSEAKAAKGQLLWDNTSIWNNKEDPAELYNATNILVAQHD